MKQNAHTLDRRDLRAAVETELLKVSVRLQPGSFGKLDGGLCNSVDDAHTFPAPVIVRAIKFKWVAI